MPPSHVQKPYRGLGWFRQIRKQLLHFIPDHVDSVGTSISSCWSCLPLSHCHRTATQNRNLIFAQASLKYLEPVWWRLLPLLQAALPSAVLLPDLAEAVTSQQAC
jgi:hypothetical protein